MSDQIPITLNLIIGVIVFIISVYLSWKYVKSRGKSILQMFLCVPITFILLMLLFGILKAVLLQIVGTVATVICFVVGIPIAIVVIVKLYKKFSK